MRLNHLNDTEIQLAVECAELDRTAVAHLVVCGQCAAELAAYRRLWERLRQAEDLPDEEDLTARVMARLPSAPRAVRIRRLALTVSRTIAVVLPLGVVLVPFELKVPAWLFTSLPAVFRPAAERFLHHLANMGSALAGEAVLPVIGAMAGLLVFLALDRLALGGRYRRLSV